MPDLERATRDRQRGIADAGNPLGFTMTVWDFDPAVWLRIRAAVGLRLQGDPGEVWARINQALVFASMEQQRRSLPTFKEVRDRRRRIVAAVDALTSLLGFPASPPAHLQVDASAANAILQGFLRLSHPGGPSISENRRGDRVPIHESVLALREHYGERQDLAQARFEGLLERLDADLRSLREGVTASIGGISAHEVRGSSPDLAKSVFVDFAAAAYEVAYKRPARPGSKEASGEPGPAVRFIDAVAQEARKADTIGPPHGALLKAALRMTPNTIRRLLQARLRRAR
ncbi:hypothetical protein [Craurococcus roseus]|uniref:hypothetical protein n=1 Tax=Craurococcus roseus TaxID=77585 RepID=UPI0031D10672